MNPEVLTQDQRTTDWFEARLGKATASRFAEVLAVKKTGTELAGRKNYRAELMLERLIGERAKERFNSPAMTWGTETEELAKFYFSERTDLTVDDCGFFLHPELEAGASPDGLIQDDGLLEMKAPNVATHVETLRAGTIPNKYIPQVQGQLWITGRKWAYFLSFEPTLPDNAQLFIQRIERDEKYINMLSSEVAKFLKEVEADVEFIKGYNHG